MIHSFGIHEFDFQSCYAGIVNAEYSKERQEFTGVQDSDSNDVIDHLEDVASLEGVVNP